MATQDLLGLDGTGASKTFLTGVGPSSKIVPKANITDEAGNDLGGTPYTGYSQPTGGAGLMGVLSDIARDSMNSDISKSHSVAVTIIPTAFTAGLHFFCLRNPDALKKIRITRIEIASYFVGTAAASRSTYTMNKYISVTGQGGVIQNILKRSTTNANSIAVPTLLAGGLALTGGTLQASVFTSGHPNQVTAVVPKDWEFIQYPLELGTNECLTLTAESAIVAGSTVHLSIQWLEI